MINLFVGFCFVFALLCFVALNITERARLKAMAGQARKALLEEEQKQMAEW